MTTYLSFRFLIVAIFNSLVCGSYIPLQPCIKDILVHTKASSDPEHFEFGCLIHEVIRTSLTDIEYLSDFFDCIDLTAGTVLLHNFCTHNMVPFVNNSKTDGFRIILHRSIITYYRRFAKINIEIDNKTLTSQPISCALAFDRVYGSLRLADPGYARISPAGTLAELVRSWHTICSIRINAVM